MNAAALLRRTGAPVRTHPLEAVSLVAVLALGALLDTHDLHAGASYDEGVYLASLRELEHGAALASQVFASQPPGFYWLLRLAGLAGSSPAAIRSVFVVIGLAGVIAIWWLVRSLAGAAAGIVAGALLALTPAWTAETARIEADPPSVVFALAALALARRTPLLAGALLAAALSIKLLAVSAVVPFVLLCGRGIRRAALGAAVAAAAILLPAVSSIGALWHQAVDFHFSARSTPGPSMSDNLHRVVHFADPRTAAGLLALLAIGYAAAVLVLRHRLLHWRLWAWSGASALLLVVQRPLFDHHMVLLAASLAAPAAAMTGEALRPLGRPMLAVAAAALVAAAGFGYARLWQETGSAAPTSPDVTQSVAFLQSRLPQGSEVASDLEIVPYLAGMRQPPDLVDLSVVRLAAGAITDATILAESKTSAAFVVGRTLAGRPAVVAALRRRYARTVEFGSVAVYLSPRAGA